MLPVLVRGFLSHPVARRRPVACARRIAWWQVRSRLSKGPHIVPFVNGARLWARRGEAGVTGNIYYGLHEFADMAFVAHALRQGELFADIGANAGTYTVLAASVAGARVVAVEPVPETLARLRANVALNGLEGQVRVEPCAISGAAGIVRFTAGGDTTNRVVSGESELEVLDLPARTADEVFAAEKPLVMKIDVEGHEGAVLAAASEVLADPGPMALILEISGDPARVATMLAEFGFQARSYDPVRRRLGPGDTGAAGNTLFVRAGAEAGLASRLAAADPVRVAGMSV